ncbi:MAG: hypothetical protein HFI70_15065 [Lachnospiraceae bacterium]|nr:hypothetical protein [Lachnospiraceae bacterium]
MSSITLNAAKLSVNKGTSVTLRATVTAAPGTDRTVKWSSSNREVATVDNGKIIAKKAGKAIITATAGDKKESY